MNLKYYIFDQNDIYNTVNEKRYAVNYHPLFMCLVFCNEKKIYNKNNM